MQLGSGLMLYILTKIPAITYVIAVLRSVYVAVMFIEEIMLIIANANNK